MISIGIITNQYLKQSKSYTLKKKSIDIVTVTAANKTISQTPEEIINDIENKIEIMNDYNAGRRIVLIGSLNKYYGDDQHEAVLERGIVLAIIK